jgi:protoporphyrinogen oxidase
LFPSPKRRDEGFDSAWEANVKQHVVIIGAGITGLTTAYKLLRDGSRVTVIEKNPDIGGLAASFLLDGSPVDRYYHFICKEDHDLIALTDELGLKGNLQQREGTTGSYVDGTIYPFNTPFDLMAFSPIPFFQRIRFGLHAWISQRRKDYLQLDEIPAKQWLIRNIGYEAYMAVWDPLLRIKFGQAHENISAAWIWHRIHRVATSRNGLFSPNSYGYFDQGCFTLLNKLHEKARESEGFELLANETVETITVRDGQVTGVKLQSDGRYIEANTVVSTIAVKDFLKIAPNMDEYSDQLGKIQYINVICLLLQLDRAFSNHFWLNVNDPNIAFNGIVEVTNLNPRPDMNNPHIVYIPFYLDELDSRWAASDDELLDECIAAMKIIRPDFNEDWIQNRRVFRDRNAQALCSVGFVKIMPGHGTPVDGLYITDSSQYYPEDRTLSASVRLAAQVVDIIHERTST